MITLTRRPTSIALIQKIALSKRHGKALSQDGFTLVELLIVVVILGILSSVGVPAYLNQQGRARENAANAAATGAAKACAAFQITTDGTETFAPGDGVTAGSTCNAAGTASTFTSDIPGLATQAVATVATDGSVSLTTEAAN